MDGMDEGKEGVLLPLLLLCVLLLYYKLDIKNNI